MAILIALFNQHPYLLWSIAIIIGLILGSFINVVIYRLPRMLEQQWQQECTEFLNETQHLLTPQKNSARFDLILPRSHCPQCQHRLTWWENIPVLSYLILRAKCRKCQHPISYQYPIIEIITAGLCFLSIYSNGLTILALPAVILSLGLLALAGIDFKHQLLPDIITLSLLWLGLFFSLFHFFSVPTDAIIGALVGYLSLWLVNKIFQLITHKQGMGNGDFKLLAALGAWFGWQALPILILISAGVGTVIGISLILLKRQQRQQPIPFGPFLALAAWIYLFAYQPITGLYLRLLGLH